MDEPTVAFTKVSDAPRVHIKDVTIELIEDTESPEEVVTEE